jgi:hypothetical protein
MHDGNTKVLETPAQDEIVSYPPPQNFDNFLPRDLEEEMDEHMSVFNPPCYDTDTDIVDIDEFIHVGRRKWDEIGFGMDPVAVLIHTRRRELSPAHLVCPRRHNA